MTLMVIYIRMKYELIPFHAVDDQKRVVYHTNVVMSMCSKVAIVCLDAIPNDVERDMICNTVKQVRAVDATNTITQKTSHN